MNGGGQTFCTPRAAPDFQAVRPGIFQQAVALLAMPQAWAWRHRCQALEYTLDTLADRLARTELALLRAQQERQQAVRQATDAEAALVRVQSMLDTLRQRQGGSASLHPR